MRRTFVVLGIVFLAQRARADSALVTLANGAATDLEAAPRTLVVSAPVRSDEPLSRSDDLASRIASTVAGKMSAVAHGAPLSLDAARAIASRWSRLIFLQPEILRGQLRLTLDAYKTVGNGWDRVRAPQPAPHAHAFVVAAVDAEVRTFLPAIALERAELRKASHQEADVLAIACGDLDDDGGLEIAMVSRTRIAVGAIEGNRFVPRVAVPWTKVKSRLPVGLRDPLAAALVTRRSGAPVLLASTSDHGGAAFDAKLTRLHAFDGAPWFDSTCVEFDFATSAYGAVQPCFLGQAAAAAPVSPPFDAMSAAWRVAPDGASTRVAAVRLPSGNLRLQEGTTALDIPGAGAQLALADLDQDGAVEVVTTMNTAEDALVVSTWERGALRPRLRFDAPAGVRAVAACPPEVNARPSVVAVVGKEVWRVR